MKIQRKGWPAALLALCLLTAGCGLKTPAADAGKTVSETMGSGADESKNSGGETLGESGAESEQGDKRLASAQETGSQIDVVQAGMEPVHGSEVKDGIYSIKVDSSSSMFRIELCELTVKEGAMSAVMSMSGTGYAEVYLGTGAEAVKAPEEDYIPYTELADGTYTFEVPVEALDMGIDLSAFSKRKEKWYDRILVFRADSLPADAFTDGKITTVESLKLTDGNYDYMKVDGVKYELKNKEGNSAFEIPVGGFDWKIAVIADTIAMSEPHEIEYTLTFDSSTLKKAE